MRRALTPLVASLLVWACQPVTSPPPTATAVRSERPGPTIAASALDGTWTPLTLPQVFDTTSIADVIADDTGFVLVGSVNDDPAAWSSTDAVAWTVDRLPGPPRLTPTSAWRTHAGVVLLGGGGTDRCAHPATALTWARPKGGEWSVAPFDKLFCANPYVAEVVSGDHAMVLAGTGFGEVGLAWRSQDGLHWVDTTAPGMQVSMPRAAAWSGTEYVVLALDDAHLGTGEWTSPDGVSWTNRRGALPAPMYGATLARVGDTLIAVVQGDDDRTSLWSRAADGTWTPTAIPNLDPAVELHAVATLGNRTVFRASENGRQLLIGWQPGDGTATIVALPEGAIDLLGVAAFGGTVVALGGIGSEDERHPAAWSAPSAVLP